MIIVREGLPGGGKTLSAVGEDVLLALEEERLVVTNIWLDHVAIAKLLRKDIEDCVVYLDPEERMEKGLPIPFSVLSDFTDYEGRVDRKQRGPRYVIDECHEAFATKSPEWKQNGEALVQWFAKHRHKACDVTLITQDRMSIPVEIRRRCEFFYRYKKLAMMGLKGAYMKATFHRDSEQQLRSDFGRYPKQWFGLYRSTLDRVREKLPPVKNIFFTWRMMLIWGVAALLLLWVFGNGLRVPGTAGKKAVAATTAAAKTPTTPVVPEPPKYAHQVTQHERQLLDQIEEAKVRAKADLVDDARMPVEGDGGGGLIPGKAGEGGSEFRYVQLPDRRPRFTLDGVWLVIEGYIQVNNVLSYHLKAVKDGNVWLMKGADLLEYGFELTPISNCIAFARSVDWGTYRLVCDAPVKIGGPDFVTKGEKVTAAQVKPW